MLLSCLIILDKTYQIINHLLAKFFKRWAAHTLIDYTHCTRDITTDLLTYFKIRG
jgi:hypothetical protein